jgi:hypothetical protein
MIGHLYRYPHPHDPTRFIYVGQGAKRDSDHRRGTEGFGRRFKKRFPNIELSQPVREIVEVKDRLELNELETIWMFQYHTWRGYEDGMNLTFPGGTDYMNLGMLGTASVTHEQRIINASKGGLVGGLVAGRKAKESGRIQKLGRQMAESGQLASARSQDNRTKEEKAEHMNRVFNLPQSRAARVKHATELGLANSVSGRIQKLGHEQGKKNVESGHIHIIKDLPQTKKAKALNGLKLKETKKGIFGRTAQQRKDECRKGGLSSAASGQSAKNISGASHLYWHIRRNKPNPRCIICSEQSLIVAYA